MPTTHTTHPVKRYSLTLLQDHELLHSLNVVLSRDHETTADLIAHLAEVVTRRLWAAEGYPSMLEFCVRGLHMSEGVALKRIQAAKTANQFPAIYALVAHGKLHLSAVCMLAPRLTAENAPGLLRAATHQSKTSIAKLLAERFLRPDVPTSIRPLAGPAYDPDHTVPDAALLTAPAHVSPAKVAPLSAETYELRCTLGKQLHEKLRYVQALLGRTVASGDIPAVLELALDALAAAKEKQKFAVTSRPRQHKGAPQGRHIPAQVRRQVLERDGGCCTFRSDKGTVCGSQRGLHFDHIVPFACGGESTAGNLRLRCAAHNRLEAERQFGRGFMDRKVQEARSAGAQVLEGSTTEVQPAAPEQDPHDPDHTAILAQREEIFPYLRALKFKLEEARYGATLCDHLVGQPLEVCVKHALQQLSRTRFERCTVRPSAASAFGGCVGRARLGSQIGDNVSAQSGAQVLEPGISTVPEHVDRTEAATKPSPHDPDHTALATQHDEIVCCPRSLKFSLEEARYGATLCDHQVGQPLGVCVKHALKQLSRARFERCTVRPTSAGAVNR